MIDEMCASAKGTGSNGWKQHERKRVIERYGTNEKCVKDCMLERMRLNVERK